MTPILAESNFCKLQAYVVDEGADLLNVRKQPNSHSQIIGQLPPNTDLKILKTNGNWVLIKPVARAANIEFQSQGWVFSSLLGISTRGYSKKSVTIFKKANPNSGIAARIPANKSVKLLSCQGEWVQIETDGVRGWLAPKDQCAAPFTTCS